MTRRKVVRPFVGVDGEGGTVDGRHEYFLIRAGDYSLESDTKLSSEQCLEFLTRLPSEPIYVAYFFDYDVTMILRNLPEERIRRILNRELRTRIPGKSPLPVDVGEYQIDYLPHKEFKVRKQGGAWIVINDVGTFFQTSFVKTLDKWSIGTDDERESIKKGKDSRNEFVAVDEEMHYYNALEIRLLEQLMTKFRETCQTIGYIPYKWQGPGNLASAMLKRHGVPKTEEITYNAPWQVWEIAQNAYYGGRFETTAAGPINGQVWQYDINSAYPWACTQLPCLRHSTWKFSKMRPDVRYWIAELGFGHGKHNNPYLCHLPVRMADGSIRFPRQGRGWYWSVEVLAAERAGTTTYCDSGYWACVEQCTCNTFGWIPSLYTLRTALGKSDKGMLLKLGLNSLYGKQAQSIGVAPYANPIYAGLITSLTRARLIDAYRASPKTCYMLATDAVFMGEELELPTGGLGDWNCITHDDGMFIIQPGLYFTSKGIDPKTRGVPMAKVLKHEADFRNSWENGRAEVPLFLRNFIGLRLACARNNLSMAGQWVEDWRSVSFDWSTKRRPYACVQSDRGLRTLPYDGWKELLTVPYDRVIGGDALKLREIERFIEEDGPDWADRMVELGGWE